MVMFSRKRLAAAAVVGGAVLVAAPEVLLAQSSVPVERNLPPVVTGQGRLVIGPQDLAGSPDDAPLGVALSGIALIGPKDGLSAKPARGIRIGAVGDIDRAALQSALAPFLGQPLSRKRMSDIQAAIATVYRAQGYPFVSVTLPPQEVTGGVLTLRVVEFRTGAVKVSGAAPGTEADLAARVRAQPGQRISADALEEDLAWLNRNPYHTVNGVFAPGDALGLSTLTLEVTPQKPWQMFGGWSNTGTRATGLDRYFTGFAAALPGLPESYASYQVTGSPDFWTDPAKVGRGADQPNYYSQAARIVVSTGARQSLEIVPSYVATRQNDLTGSFAFDSKTLEVPLYYRTAISNLAPGLHAGDLIIGVTGKTVSRTSYFTGVDIGGARADLVELIAGWSLARSDAYGSTGLDLRLIGNPGGVIGGNNVARWSGYSGGRVTDVSYVYGTGELGRVTRLPAGFAWVSNLSGTLAGQPLPDTEQMGLGGLSATRGYLLDDAKVDTGAVWRNELRAPSVPLLAASGVAGILDQVSPYAFVDMSWGRVLGYQGVLGAVPRRDYSLAGIGLGLDYTLNRNLTASLVGGFALTDANTTRTGAFNVQARVFVSY